jgi:hypothetical protein
MKCVSRPTPPSPSVQIPPIVISVNLPRPYLSLGARGADLLYQVFNRRYQRASTIVTTNLAFKDWGTLFHNSAAASAIADRLVHKGLLVRVAERPG